MADPLGGGNPEERLRIPETEHQLVIADAAHLDQIAPASVALVVTSPPYPMIEMWDRDFSEADPEVAAALADGRGWDAFNAMHAQLCRVWRRLEEFLIPGGILCINIGDATRSVAGKFQMYPNHARIVEQCTGLGFQMLPSVLWRKQTNAPNKFMGSGMLPAGAYVTLEHEFILVFRKGQKRGFHSNEARALRRRSAMFWEERNRWFSDVWDFKRIRQALSGSAVRSRTAAFPLELAYRLVAMYSVFGDTVLDPFAGTGTAAAASACLGRNSISVERAAALRSEYETAIRRVPALSAELASARLTAHSSFIAEYAQRKGGMPKHYNALLGMPVVTGQERELVIPQAHDSEQHEPELWRVRYQ